MSLLGARTNRRFFTNAIDTRTRGLDITLGHRRPMGAAWLSLTAGLNLNETEVQRINTAPGLAGKEDIHFNMRERMFVEGSAPKTKGTLSADYDVDRWGADVALLYFGLLESGRWSQIDDPTLPPQKYDPRVTTDLHFSFALPRNLKITIGGVNVFDVQPTEQDPFETENGALWENVQMGINGAAYYVRLSFRLPDAR